MELFKKMKEEGHEQVIFMQENKTNLKAIIAIHNTVLGPALGGCRMWNYDTEEEAVIDALRLAKGMTYKSGIAGEDFGGGKTVIWGDPETDKSEGLFRALGKFINALNGRYSTGTDVGTTYDDFVLMRKETPYVGALPEEYGGSGDSSIPTAYGTFLGIRASCKEKYGSESLEGKTVAVQGLGKVGSKLVKHLMNAGAEVYATDINEDYIKWAREQGVKIVEPDEIYDVDCDIFSPNALGAVINDDTIERLKCDIVAGAANNVLKESRHGDMLHEKGILYAPDYVINAGGLIQVADEMDPSGYSEERTMKKTEKIYDQLLEVYRISRENNISTQKAADHLVEERIKTMAAINTIKDE
ncbi:MAG: Leu/Phe/Val dehydrogenase [Bacillota bacterium]